MRDYQGRLISYRAKQEKGVGLETTTLTLRRPSQPLYRKAINGIRSWTRNKNLFAAFTKGWKRKGSESIYLVTRPPL
jgi:hypothetical protein